MQLTWTAPNMHWSRWAMCWNWPASGGRCPVTVHVTSLCLKPVIGFALEGHGMHLTGNIFASHCLIEC